MLVTELAGFLMRRPASAGAYSIARSLRFNDDDSAYLSRTPGGAGNRTVWTASFWVKRGAFTGSGQDIFSAGTSTANTSDMGFDSSDKFYVSNYISSSYVTQKITTRVFRDPAAWYHIVVASNGATSLNIYVNGVLETSFSTNTGPTSANWMFNGANTHNIGRYAQASNQYFDGYLADFYLIDGAQLTPSSFGETNATTGQWVPKQPSGLSYGTNGFWLSFYDNTSTTTLGRDDAGGAAGSAAGSNDWTLNNLSATAGQGNDSLTDTPTNNYCVMNPLRTNNTHSNGNLDIAVSTASANTTFGTFGMSSGKWYWETVFASGSVPMIGLCTEAVAPTAYFWSTATGWAYYNDGTKYTNNAGTSYGNTYTTGDIIGVAFDADNGKLFFSKNGTWQASGDPAAGTNAAFTGLTSGPYFPAVSDGSSGSSATVVHNFGQRAFSYTPPTGFSALCTSNLSTPSIVKPSAHFNATLYTGNGSARSITGLGHQPDLVWIKARSAASHHSLYDSARGVRKTLASSAANVEGSESSGVSLTSFDGDGFSLGTDNAVLGSVNANATTYAAWGWKEGVTPGFDIVSYTGDGTSGRDIAHGLGVAPKMIITKARSDATYSWHVWHTGIGSDYYLGLNTTAARDNSVNIFPGAGITSSNFRTASSATRYNNLSAVTYIAYLWAEVAGFSRFGSYTGNASTDGPFVYCGFRPRWIMVKRTDSTGNWNIYDTARNAANLTNLAVYADLTNAEATETNNVFDILSNGFKVRGTGTASNASGGTYIYAAFAEFPFKYSNAR